jgi:hypothetical protein
VNAPARTSSVVTRLPSRFSSASRDFSAAARCSSSCQKRIALYCVLQTAAVGSWPAQKTSSSFSYEIFAGS